MNIRRTTAVVFLLLNVFLLLSKSAFSWSGNGHVAMGQMSYELLSNGARKNIDRLLDSTFDTNVVSDLELKYRRYGKFSTFAILITLPDEFKELTVGNFYKKFGGTIPDDLVEFKDIAIKYFHRINRSFPENNCTIFSIPGERLFLTKLKHSLKHDLSTNTQAISLILMSHIVMDYHQPLHSFGHVNSDCKYDKGGNKFCVVPLKQGKCPEKYRLHFIFDTIYFEDITEAMKRINVKYNLHSLPKEKSYYDLKPESWWNENYAYASYIYSIKQYEGLSVEYKSKIKDFLGARAAKAIFRLSLQLENVLNYDVIVDNKSKES